MTPNYPDIESLVEIVSARAISDPSALAYGFLEAGEVERQRLTWQDIEERSLAIAHAIAATHQPGARVLVLFPPGLDFIPAFFGCLRAGAIALPSYPPSGVNERLRPERGATAFAKATARPPKRQRRRKTPSENACGWVPARIEKGSGRRGTLVDRTVARLRGMIPDAGVSLVLTCEAIAAKRTTIEALVPEMVALRWLTIEEAVTVEPQPHRLPKIRRSDVALLQYTSGSTTSPRGVMVTHGNLLHNLACSARVHACHPESVGVSWLPVNHDMGLIGGILQPAFSGFPMWLMAPAAFLQRPARWVEAISRFRATHSAGPDFAYALCARRVTDADRRMLDLSSWRVACNGSEPIRPSTLESFQRAFGECGFGWAAWSPAYGLAEATLFVSGSQPDADPVTLDVDRSELGHGRVADQVPDQDRLTLVSSGAVAESLQIAIVDPVRRTRCGVNQVGEVWIAGGSVAAGYWHRREETAATFGAFLESPREGPFLRTGDLGFIRNGALFVTGRLKDVLIIRGVKHYPQDLEATAERAHASVRAGGCAAFSLESDSGDEAIAVLAEVDAGEVPEAQVLTDIRCAIADAHQVQVSAVVLVPAGSLPRTTSGKLQRFRCREAFVSGALDALPCWIAPAVALRRAS
jgi:acyl-CoA synthetase (AMP-forming)/AMP-acid ligase II